MASFFLRKAANIDYTSNILNRNKLIIYSWYSCLGGDRKGLDKPKDSEINELRVSDQIKFTNKNTNSDKYCEFKIYNQLFVLLEILGRLYILILIFLNNDVKYF